MSAKDTGTGKASQITIKETGRLRQAHLSGRPAPWLRRKPGRPGKQPCMRCRGGQPACSASTAVGLSRPSALLLMYLAHLTWLLWHE